MQKLIKTQLYIVFLVLIYSCSSDIIDKDFPPMIEGSSLNGDTIKYEQKSKYVIEGDICSLDIGNSIRKENLIGKYNLLYGYIENKECHRKCFLVETREGLDFLDSNSYEMLTFFNKDSTIDVGEGNYKLIGDSLILTYSPTKSNQEQTTEVFKITGKSDTIYFQKRNFRPKEPRFIYEYIKVE